MNDAVPEFREVLDRTELGSPSVPVFSCTTAKPFADIRPTLAEALVRPVRWTETLKALEGTGAGPFLEVGPGKILTGLVRRTLPEAEAIALEAADG
jgi:[acyl-carrier-protein] S-malonyltransferase